MYMPLPILKHYFILGNAHSSVNEKFFSGVTLQLRVAARMSRLYKGKLLQLEKVRTLTGKKIEARSHAPVLTEVDGERPGVLPATGSSARGPGDCARHTSPHHSSMKITGPRRYEPRAALTPFDKEGRRAG
jgi:hypothetical protein